jgi:6-phosphogluconolactonase
MNVMEFDNEEDLGMYCAEFIEDLINNKNRSGDIFTLAVSGGRSPASTYEQLGTKNIDWKKVFVFLADERMVGHNDGNSNFRFIKETLLDKSDLPDENIFEPDTTLPDPNLTASVYEKSIRSFFETHEVGKELPAFDLICLGIGDDGHTASLFPGVIELDEKDKLIVATKAPDQIPVKDRISFTLKLINNAGCVMFIVSGKNKGSIVKKVINGDMNLPASLVKPRGELMLMLNRQSLD